MTLVFKYGKGKGNSYISLFSIGGLEITLSNQHRNATLKQLADALAKKFKIKDGEIELCGVSFANYKRNR